MARPIREILAMHFQDGLSQRKIAAELGIKSKSSVGEIIGRARKAGLSWPLPAGATDDDLEELLYHRRSRGQVNEPSPPPRPQAPEPPGPGPGPEQDEESEHLRWFGLSFNPFPVAPDTENFYISPQIDMVLTEIVHGIVTRKGFMVLTGDVGLGKTTISRRILAILEERGVETSLVFHTSFQDVELLREINRDFGLISDSMVFGDQLQLLNEFLLDRNSRGRNCAIIIDDAQNLTPDSLELVRMISNLEANQRKLVQILLIGQQELLEKLNQPQLRQVRSRIIIRAEARPLSLGELRDYVTFKLNAAGSQGRIKLTAGAFRRLHSAARGNFRQVNIIMDRVLYVAFNRETTTISREAVQEAYIDLFPEQALRSARRRVAAGLAVLLVLCLVAVGLTLPNGYAATWDRARRALAGWTSVFGPTAGAAVESSSALEEFLAVYGLAGYSDRLRDALARDDLDRLADEIYHASGYLMVRWPDAPERVTSGRPRLSHTNGAGRKIDLFLWKGGPLIGDFTPGRNGPDIRRLQELLAEAGAWNEGVDGRVGPDLQEAVKRFQKQYSLEPTGFPDARTVFLLNIVGEDDK